MLITASMIVAASEAQGEQQLVVTVIDGDGDRRGGVEVVLSNETYRAKFVTDDEGQAFFRFIGEGTYELSVTIDGVKVASRSVDYPSEHSVELLLKVRDLKLVISDLGGKTVSGLNITVKSMSGSVEKQAVTNEDGEATIADLPYSELEGVGVYNVSARIGSVVVLDEPVVFPAVEGRVRLTANLAGAIFKLLDLEGSPIPSGTVRLVSPLFEAETGVKEGVAGISRLPTSQAAGIYTMEVLMRYPGGSMDVLVYRRELEVNNYTDETIVLDLGRLVVRVSDDAGEPLPNLEVNLKSARHGLISTQRTDLSGRVEFVDIPLSTGEFGAGEYLAELLKRDIDISHLRVSLLSQREEINHTVERREFVIILTKPDGEPLSEAAISLRDAVTGRGVEAVSDPSGRAVVSALPGLHSYSVSISGRRIAGGTIELAEGENLLRVSGVDIEVRLRIVDWAGSPVDSAQPKLYSGSQPVPLEKIGAGTYSAVIPFAGEVRVDVMRGDELLQRKIFLVGAPTELTLRLRGLNMGGTLIDVDTLILIPSAIFLGISVAIFPVLYLTRMRRG